MIAGVDTLPVLDLQVRTSHRETNEWFVSRLDRSLDCLGFPRPAQRAVDDRAVDLLISDAYLPQPVFVRASSRVDLTVRDIRGISHYAGLQPEEYLTFWILVGVVKAGVLRANEYLATEDLNYYCDPRCPFARRPRFEDYALTFDAPAVCEGCLRFYESHGAKSEIQTLADRLADRSDRQIFVRKLTT